ncbi:hypothetical protein [Streptococcus ovis]|uniref:hypothetical protein n=1 Tax=Streptococcus ovis TaxID=82806 RepID=UPI000361AB65|nr:hypothetical protein [Streptococcus ovis]
MIVNLVKEKLGLIFLCLGLLFLSVVPHISTKETVVFGLGLISLLASAGYAYKAK